MSHLENHSLTCWLKDWDFQLGNGIDLSKICFSICELWNSTKIFFSFLWQLIKKQITRFELQSIWDMNMSDLVQLTQKGTVAVSAFTAQAHRAAGGWRPHHTGIQRQCWHCSIIFPGKTLQKGQHKWIISYLLEMKEQRMTEFLNNQVFGCKHYN